MFDEGISHESLLVDIAAEAGIIEKSGAWYAYGKERIGQGRENAKLYLKDHPDLAVEVEAKVKEHLGINPVALAADEEASAPKNAHRTPPAQSPNQPDPVVALAGWARGGFAAPPTAALVPLSAK